MLVNPTEFPPPHPPPTWTGNLIYFGRNILPKIFYATRLRAIHHKKFNISWEFLCIVFRLLIGECTYVRRGINITLQKSIKRYLSKLISYVVLYVLINVCSVFSNEPLATYHSYLNVLDWFSEHCTVNLCLVSIKYKNPYWTYCTTVLGK